MAVRVLGTSRQRAAAPPPGRYRTHLWQWLGLCGAVLVAAGGVLAGAAPARGPLLPVGRIQHLRDVTVFSTAVVYLGLTLITVAWWSLGASVRGPNGPSTRQLLTMGAWWSLPFALSEPIFSGDVYSYLAQGAMMSSGLDTYTTGPAALGGPLAANVPAIWQHTPAPYGPVFLGLAGVVTRLTGHHTWSGILGMRVLALCGVGLLAWSVPRLARVCQVDPRIAVWLGVINPLVLLHLVADAHNDAVMLGLMSVGLVLALSGRPGPGVAMVTLAGLVKAPGAVALAFVVPVWAWQLTGRLRWARAVGASALIAVGTTIAVTIAAGTGYGWVRTLGTPTLARTWMSLTTDLGYLSGRILRWLGLAGVDQTRRAFWLAGLVVAAAVCALLLRRSARVGAVAALGLSLAVVVVLGPVVHPWYLLWGLVPLATAGSAMVRRGLAAASVVLILLVLPGGVTPGLPVLLGAGMGTCLALLIVRAMKLGEDRQRLANGLG